MRDHFKQKASNWDINDIANNISSGVSSAIQDNVTIDCKIHVMDFGAGTGLITQHIANRADKVTAVDVSRSMLDKLSEKNSLNTSTRAAISDAPALPTSRSPVMTLF